MPTTAIEVELRHAAFETPLGELVAVFGDDGLRRLDFDGHPKAASAVIDRPTDAADLLSDEIARYFSGEVVDFRTPLAPVGTPFQQTVWRALRKIPHGETRSYAELAAAIGRPTACRAVAQANARNPISILIPCHRVIGADGRLTGYASGVERKRFLLDLERGGSLFA